MSVEVVVKSSVHHGEGPHWDDVTQSLYYVDCYINEVHRFDTRSGNDTKIHLGDGLAVTIFIPRTRGGYLATQLVGLSIVDSFDSDKVTPFVKILEDGQVLNDGKCDSSGRLWVGSTSGPRGATGIETWPTGLGSLFSVEADGDVKSHLTSLDLPNGLDWSSDGRTMYFADSARRQVWAFDFDVNAGKISNQRTVVDLGRSPIHEMSFPDGLVVDEEDKLWVALWDASKVARFDPETGKMMQSVSFPCQRITSCCFGGKNLDELYVTSSKYPEHLTETPLAGSLFKVTGLGVKGRRLNMFAG
ncbi:regucalcin-like [Gigantopelta aegis]|uniref:regucalcin-like n=1 Tax=Gigantopelta aegis TaxID=1735272 RepID=UPI001B889ADB|nr:regucalcin-like [Gigantopelta aegis]